MSNHDIDTRNPQQIIRAALRWALALAVLMWALIILGVMAMCSTAHAATGLAVVTRDAAAKNQPVVSVASAIVYAVPKAGDFLRVSSTNTSWSADYDYVAYADLLPGQQVEVCTSDTAPESTNCTSWGWAVVKPRDPRTFVLNWSHTAQDTTGASVTLTGFRIAYGTTANALTQIIDVPDGTARSYALSVPKFATTYYVAITALAGAQESTKSNTITRTSGVDPSIPPPVQIPTPPVLTLATVGTLAYQLTQSTNKITLATVGTVPLGLPCTRLALPGGVIDVLADRTKAVIASGKTRPSAVVVSCG